MGYYLRYFMADTRPIQLQQIKDRFESLDPAYGLEPDIVDDLGRLTYNGKLIALIEINRAGEEIFDDDLDEFKALIGTPTTEAEHRVYAHLTDATAIIAVEAFWKEADMEDTLSRIDPLWEWLFSQRAGILQADGEGFYDPHGLIVERRSVL